MIGFFARTKAAAPPLLSTEECSGCFLPPDAEGLFPSQPRDGWFPEEPGGNLSFRVQKRFFFFTAKNWCVDTSPA